MNAHILLVMKWLNDNDSVGLTELIANRDEAQLIAHVNPTLVLSIVYNASYYAVAGRDQERASQYVDAYFIESGENKAMYDDAIAKMKPTAAWAKLAMVALLIIAVSLMSHRAHADDIAVTFFGNSVHPFSDDMNGKHELLGLEYLDTSESYTVGYGVSTFINSYSIRGYMYTQTAYIHWDNYPLTTVLMGGVTTGYKDTGAVCIMEVGALCAVAGLGIQYDTYAIKPRVTMFGGAIVLSLSYTF